MQWVEIGWSFTRIARMGRAFHEMPGQYVELHELPGFSGITRIARALHEMPD